MTVLVRKRHDDPLMNELVDVAVASRRRNELQLVRLMLLTLLGMIGCDANHHCHY
jgi:hypothetical protein